MKSETSSNPSFRNPRLFVLASLLTMTAAAFGAVPANPVVEILFSEGPGSGAGLLTTNQGSLAGNATFADPGGTTVLPAFSINVPSGAYVPSGNTFSVDLGTFVSGAEGRAVDLTTTAAPPGNGTLGAL